MNNYLSLILTALLSTALCCPAVAQTTAAPVDSEGQPALALTNKLDRCLAGLSNVASSREERGAAAFSASMLLESPEITALVNSRQVADVELMVRICRLHIAYAEYQIEEAGINSNPPSVTALEKAFKEYRLAWACLTLLKDRNAMAHSAPRIERGLAQTIAGLNKYADWFAGDVVMNTSGKKWDANPAPQAEKLKAEIAAKTSSSSDIAICEKALEQTIKDIQRAAERKDGARALDNMILAVKWLTTILQKSPEAFVYNFQRFNVMTRPAMEEVRKGFVPEKMNEFSRFYEPLKSNYIVLTAVQK